MPRTSAGILAFRIKESVLQVLLVHPGGPFWKNKDDGSWSIPKGEYGEEEDPLKVALREFTEETGNVINASTFIPLQTIKQKSGKQVMAWAVETDFENCFLQSNMFAIEWPPKSGKMQSFPEVDKAEWFTVTEAEQKMNTTQYNLVTELKNLLQL